MDKAEPIRKVVDVEVLVSCGSCYGPNMRYGLEEYIKELRSWAKDFQYFVDDHKHQCDTYVEVRDIVETKCSVCDDEWEVSYCLDDDGCKQEECASYCTPIKEKE